MFYTYMIRTEKGTLYTGIAKDLFRRMREHTEQKEKSAKYTRCRKVVSLAALWSSRDRSTASRLEYRIKTLTKKEKEALLASPALLFSYFPELEKEDYIFHPKANLDLFLNRITLAQLP